MKKYILILTAQQEDGTLFYSIVNLLKHDFKIVYANGSAEAIGLLKFIKPALTLINCNAAEANFTVGAYLMQTIAGLKNMPVLLYASQPNKFIYISAQQNNQHTECTFQNISKTVHYIQALIHRSQKATRTAKA